MVSSITLIVADCPVCKKKKKTSPNKTAMRQVLYLHVH